MVDVPRLTTLAVALLVCLVPMGTMAQIPGDLIPQDDAGSGQDAPDGPVPEVWVEPDTQYKGNTTGLLGDTADWYAFEADAGVWFQLTALVGNCANWSVHDEAGAEVASQCRAPPSLETTQVWLQAHIPEAGVYFLAFSGHAQAPMHYRFSFTFLDEPAEGPPGLVPDGLVPDDLVPDEIPPQDDAGSGQDAPDGPVPEVWVEPDVDYQGNTTGLLGDSEDWFALEGEAGQWFQLQAVGGNCNTWSLRDASGGALEGDCRALSQESVDVWLQVRLEEPGLHFLRFGAVPAQVPVHYRFAFSFSDLPNPPPSGLVSFSPDHTHLGVDACPMAEDPATGATHGFGDPYLEDLSWAALKTGFRAVVAWSSPDSVSATLRVLQEDGGVTEFTDMAPTLSRAFVVDNLPVGKLMCFQAEHETLNGTVTGDWHALRLQNAMNAWDEEAGAYTLNLLVLANEHVLLGDLAMTMIDYEDRLWDSTEGYVRSGAVIVLYNDYQKHNSGLITCGVFPITFLPTCNTEADVVFSYDNLPFAAGATFIDGIQSPTRAIFMNNAFSGSYSSAAATLLHEVGHYAFGMMDMYTNLGQGPNCWDSETRISVMGNHPNRREFDDETTRCPNEDAIIAEYGAYVPAWTSFIARFPHIPERPGDPVPGPYGTGGAFHLHSYRFLPGAGGPGPVDVPQDDAGSGQDAPGEPVPEVWVLPGVKYQGNTTGLLGDSEDWYAFDAVAGSTLRLRALGGNCVTWSVTNTQGEALDQSCSAPMVPPNGVTLEVELEEQGLHFLRFQGVPAAVPVHYRFAFGFDEDPPEPFP